MTAIRTLTTTLILVTLCATVGACGPEQGADGSRTAAPTAGTGGGSVAGGSGAGEAGTGGGVEKTALAAPSKGGKTLLVALPPAETGIVAQNVLPMEESAPFIFVSGGVAAADYDLDGRVDLYVVSATGANHLYHNEGDWKFTDVTEAQGVGVKRDIQTGPWPKRYSVGAFWFDADNDRDPDLLVTNFAGPNSYFRNDGGKLIEATQAAGLDYAGASTTAAFADYDHDGDVDFYLATYRPYGDSIVYPRRSVPADDPLRYDVVTEGEGKVFQPEKDLLYQNNGDGTFTNVAAKAGIGEYRDWGLAANFADVTGDGWPDLYVANDFSSPDRFYVNNGDGTFKEMPLERYRHGSMYSMGMDFGDFNNDGRLDYMTSDMATDKRERRQMEGMDSTTTDMVGMGMAMGDQVMRNGLFVNNGDGTFSDVAAFAGVMATDWTWSIKFADVDLDGFQDLLVTNGFIRDDLNLDLRVKLTQLRSQNKVEESDQLQRSWPRLRTNDFAFQNEGGMRFKDVSDAWGFNDSGAGYGMTLADFDGDGDLDAVVNNQNDPVAVYRNDATNPRAKVILAGQASNRFGLGARLTLGEDGTSLGLREMTISGGYGSSHEPTVVYGEPEGWPAKTLAVRWPSGQTSTVPDFQPGFAYTVTEPAGGSAAAEAPAAANAQFEDVAASSGAAFSRQETHFDDFHAQMLLPFGLSRLGPGVAWGDADGDGWEDLYVAGGQGQAGGLLKNKAGKGFAAGPAPAAPAGGVEEQGALWLAQATGKGHDLVTSLSRIEAKDASVKSQLRRADGAGVQTWSADGEADGGPLAAADYNGDGQLDLFMGGMARPGAFPLPTTSRLFRGGPNGLEDASADAPGLANVGVVNGAAWFDADGDGDLDLALATEWGPVKLFVNDGGKLSDGTQAAGLAGQKGWWHGLAVGDVDHDGDQDLVASNLGLNTIYKATDAEPLVLLAGDIDADLDPSGDVEVIEAEWQDGKLYPRRQGVEVARDVGRAMTQFSNFAAYSKATLDEVFSADRLARMTRFEANWLAHTLFVNDGGQFTAKPLPEAAQLLVGYGISLADVDNDGHDDIYMVGNLQNTESMHIGPWDSGIGVLLAGDGKGGFSAVPASQSGLSVPTDAKGLAAADYDQDGWVDLAVGVNAGALRLYHNRGREGRAGLLVRLDGPAGNPDGVGARISVKRADGLVITEQVAAGGSYLSQNGSGLVFGLGEAGSPATVTVTWPDGTETQATDAKPGTPLVLSHSR